MQPAPAPQATATSSIAYRAHIDGLRGVAVIAVVLYHAKLLWTTGGYVGVDVFFVISGFLISSIVMRDVRAGTFSLRGFWERRVRRILPALTVTILVCAVFARLFMLYPQDYHHFGNAVVAQSAFASNVLFMLTDNYFDHSSRNSPLLHTWSLSVEEQFYVLFPLLVVLCVWFARRSLRKRSKSGSSGQGERAVLWSVAALGAASFFLNLWLVDVRPGAAFGLPFIPPKIFWDTTYANAGFYLIFSRAWELALGIVLALTAFRVRKPMLAEGVALGGICAILAAVFLFDDSTAFPGLAAALPTAGAAAFIAANEHVRTKLGALLSHPSIVWVGLISYSLYLWHWPLFVFAAILFPAPLSATAMFGLVALSVGVGWVSYRFVETPFRRKTLITKRKTVFLCGGLALAATALAGWAVLLDFSHLLQRIPPAAVQILNAGVETDLQNGSCFSFPGDGSRYGGLCRVGYQSAAARPQFILWGDSHAGAEASVFDVMGKKFGEQGVAFIEGDCIPIAGARRAPPIESCDLESKNALQYIHDHDIKRIFLVARWSYYIMGGPEGTRIARITDAKSISRSPMEAQQAFARTATAMLRQLTSEGRQVYIVKQAPEQFYFKTRDAFYAAVRTGESSTMHGVSEQQSDAYQALANSVIDGLGNIPGVHVVDPASVLCAKGVCDIERAGQLLYMDENHVSIVGAMALSPLFAPIFQNMRAPAQQ